MWSASAFKHLSDLCKVQSLSHSINRVSRDRSAIKDFESFPDPQEKRDLVTAHNLVYTGKSQPAHLWQQLLKHLAFVNQLILSDRLQFRSLQWVLQAQWDFQDQESLVDWDEAV